MRCSACLLIAALAACDGPVPDPDSGTPRADGGRDAGEEGTPDAGSDAGASDDAGTRDDAGARDAGAGLRQATVSLTQNRAAPNHVVYGGFYPDIVAPPVAEEGVVPCAASATSGSCGLYRCPTLGARATAGTLIAEVEGTEIARITEPGPTGDYGFSGPTLVADPGDVVTFEATGDEVPAFTGTVTVPGAIAATLPATIDRDEPLTLTWTASGAERTQVVIGAGPDAIACIVDAADGSVVVAPELLGMLSTGTGGVALTAFNFVGVTAGDYRVLLTAGDATFQAATLE